MYKYLLIILTFILIYPGFSSATTLIDTDFNDSSWGILSHDSGWTMQSSGGVDDTPAIRLQYSETGLSPHELILNVSSALSQDFWVEMDVKITGTMNGGMKFVKFFGSSTQSSMNNMTLICDYSSQLQNRVVYYLDTICEPRYDGASTPSGSCQWTETYTHSAVDLRGGTWGHYKAHVRRADPGQSNGEVQVWWNDTEMVHLTGMNSNPLSNSTDSFAYITFGDYTNSNTSTWYYWIDNLYVGTTEKVIGGGPTLVTCYPDLDGDLYPGSGSVSVETCPSNWYEASHFTAMTFDCNDSNPGINPGIVEECGVNDGNGIDEDCSGSDLYCAPDSGGSGGSSAIGVDRALFGNDGRSIFNPSDTGRMIITH